MSDSDGSERAVMEWVAIDYKSTLYRGMKSEYKVSEYILGINRCRSKYLWARGLGSEAALIEKTMFRG